jgi:hypothetical protein
MTWVFSFADPGMQAKIGTIDIVKDIASSVSND